MKAHKFNFKNYQSHHKSWKLLIKFVIYGVIIFLLLYFIFSNKKASSEDRNDAFIEVFEIETNAPQSE